MANCFLHSADAGDTNISFGKWSNFNGGDATFTVNTTDPRFPGLNSVSIGGPGNPTNQALQKIVKASQEHEWFIAGRAIHFPTGTAVDGNAQGTIMRFFGDGGTTTHVAMSISTAGEIVIRRGSGSGTVLATSATGVFAFNTWGYIAMKARLSDTVGEVYAEYNGVVVASATGLDTRNGGTDAVFDAVGFAWGRGRDFYINNGAGSFNNDFAGDVLVTAQFTDSDTAQEDFTRSAGSDSFALVDEVTPDGDTSYIESSTVGHITRMGIANLTDAGNEPQAVQTSTYARKDDAGARTFRTGIFSDATASNGETFALGTGYTTFVDNFDTDPDGAVEWTAAAINALAVQVEIVA